MLSCNMLSVSTEVIDGICVVGREGGVGSGGVFTFGPGGMGRDRGSREGGMGSGGVFTFDPGGMGRGRRSREGGVGGGGVFMLGPGGMCRDRGRGEVGEEVKVPVNQGG